jgi:alkylhydroperoxidase/carboxymuconolactone decarboxylase family protein YurZ
MPNNPLDLRFLLGPEELDALRRGYLPDAMKGATRTRVGAMYPPGAPWVDALVDALYGPQPVSPKDRERCLIVLLATRGEPFTLGVHVYWGLMEGLAPEEVGHALLLAGAYHGVPAYATGLLAVQKTCAALKAAIAEQQTDSARILGRLVQVFGV